MSDEIMCCPLDGGDCDGPKVSATTTPRARKVIRCEECGKDIAAGERYERHHGLYEDAWYTNKTCMPCVAVRDHFACNGWIFGQVWSDISENFFQTMVAGGNCLSGMRPEGKAKMFEKFLEWYFEGGYESRDWWQEQEARAEEIKEARKAS